MNKHHITRNRLPIQVASLFSDVHEWTLVDYLYFRSHLDGFSLSLTEIQNSTPIKRRATILNVFERLAEKGWVTKTAIGSSGKHHKYSFNREAFDIWWLSLVDFTNRFWKPLRETWEPLQKQMVLNRTITGSLPDQNGPLPDQQRSASGPVMVLNRTLQE